MVNCLFWASVLILTTIVFSATWLVISARKVTAARREAAEASRVRLVAANRLEELRGRIHDQLRAAQQANVSATALATSLTAELARINDRLMIIFLGLQS